MILHGIARDMRTELASPSLRLGLIAYGKLDETSGTTARDDSDHHHHAALQRATFEQVKVQGKIDNAVHLTGNSFLEVPDHAHFRFIQMTLHAWVKPEASQHCDAHIISTVGRFALAMPRNQALKNYFWEVDREVDRPLSHHERVNLCATFAGIMRRFYVAGVRFASILSPQTPVVLDKPLFIGALRISGGAARLFQGTINDVRISLRALSDNEACLLHLSASASPTSLH